MKVPGDKIDEHVFTHACPRERFVEGRLAADVVVAEQRDSCDASLREPTAIPRAGTKDDTSCGAIPAPK
jgi:hypothetical protein